MQLPPTRESHRNVTRWVQYRSVFTRQVHMAQLQVRYFMTVQQPVSPQVCLPEDTATRHSAAAVDA